MPFFSFILNKNCSTSSLDLKNCDVEYIKKDTKYFSKNSSIWKILNKKNNQDLLKEINIEKHSKYLPKSEKILFCLPPNPGIGDSIEYGLAIKNIKLNKIFKEIGIAFCSNAHEILSHFTEADNIYSDFISESQIKKYDTIFHFTSEINLLKLQKYERENIEEAINNFFRIKNKILNKNFANKKISRISIFPISNSPIRTLPINLIDNIISHLINKKYEVDLILGNDQITTEHFRNLKNLNKCKVYNPSNLKDLVKYIKTIEFGVFCDSGPLHISKIYNKKGILISTSVDSKKILYENSNITYYNSNFKSNYCSAPCGLTNIINFNNEHGCYYSLKKEKKLVFENTKIHLLNRGNLKKSYKYFLNNPVGCIESINYQKIKIFLDELLK
ncbi:MAG: hypothetical protein CFH22_01303 [Alphaproteobacteria bacterium MarineAlpha5_Bin12]|nr:MAG: hypothetical protein CFH22_01303 [Alphaproteobacteria bacterium MarineAlpha5_Bin12]|tara:strand:- start:26574 stop:27737 length:1164 start_codon:yes stop_codon:yes gene_type:complete